MRARLIAEPTRAGFLRAGLAMLAASSLPFLAACSSSPYPEIAVDLRGSRTVPTGRPEPRSGVIRFSVAGMQSPQGTFAAYSRLFERLEPKVGAAIELVQRRTYQEVNELLASGDLDAALVCTGGYVALQRSEPGAVEILAVPVVRGRTTYHSYVIVSASSTAAGLPDLRGKRFAFTDELSLSGYAYPSRLLRQLGAEPRTFFASVTFTRSHDRSIEAVAKGVVDGAAVDSLVYDELVRTSPDIRAGTRVIHQSPAYGVSPVVVSAKVSPERRAAIREALLRLHDDPEARQALARVGFDKFVAPPRELYVAASALLGPRP